MNYHMAIDMWSLGCIMAELYTGFPIFPGENEQEQLSCIMEVLGIPDKDFINRSSRRRLFFGACNGRCSMNLGLTFRIDQTGAPRPVMNSKGRRRRPGSKTLQQVLRCDDELFVDFIAKCLIWDPERRLKPQAALRHPYISGGKRATKILSPQPPASSSKTLLNSASASFTSNRSSKSIPETPKKSLISAPTPLTARTSRITSGTVPTTPSSNSGSLHTTLGSSRSYRASQTQSLSYHSSHSSRTMVSTSTSFSRAVADAHFCCSSQNDLLRHVVFAFIAFYCTTYSIYALLIMTGRVATREVGLITRHIQCHIPLGLLSFLGRCTLLATELRGRLML